MSHSLSSYLGFGNFNSAAVAHYAFISYPFILSAMAFPVLHRSENSFAEKAVSLRFKSPVVDGLRLGYLAMGPFKDLFR